MSSQAAVHSIDALKDLRVALALYSEDALGALGAVDAEVRRTVHWLHEDRPSFWQEQIRRRREQVATAKAEVFRRKLAQKPDHAPSLSEPMEILRKAEASLQDAEKRLTMVRKWQPALQQALLEYQASIRRIKDLAAGDIPRAINLLNRLIDALEAYLRVAPPTGQTIAAPEAGESAGARTTAPPEFESIATEVLDQEQEREVKTPDQESSDEAPMTQQEPESEEPRS